MSNLGDRVRDAFRGRLDILREVESNRLTTDFIAHEAASQRDVVVRVLRPEVGTELDQERLLAAISSVRDISHPHVLTPSDAGQADGLLYYTVPQAGGVTVRDKLDAHGRAPIAETVRIVRAVADALAYAHGRGILHLDVRPENVLLADGAVRLTDLGIIQAVRGARRAEPDQDPVPSAYQTPEQIAGQAVDHRADIYQLGVLSYELLTGHPPAAGESSDLVEHRSECPVALARFVERCLEPDPAARWPSADEIGPALAGLESEGSDSLDRFGAYKLLRVLGKGGMGVVYLAEQEEPMKRRVALKIIKLGMDTKEVLARFDVERRALAVMDHPNIARVFDAAATATGRPYFVMELVEGVPLTAYCDEHRLSTRARLELFVEVCRAVQHAHHKGIVHRDLKPSNVVVTTQDDRPVPKVIDFGLAKAIGYRLGAETLVTERDQLLGTPAYMSPEQAGGIHPDVDTRTDVYSLGVMLYELLVGSLPIDPAALSSDGAAVRDAIRDSDPAKPSVRFHSLGDTQSRVAELRRTEAHALQRQLRGDLDWITMKALEKDRGRRYATVNDLLRDVERHLHNDPVEARGPSARYRFGKFVRRHRVGVVSTTLVAASLVLGLATTTTLWMRATRAERAAAVEAETARQVSDFLEGLFAVSDPNETRGNTVTARELLDSGAAQIAAELEGQPLVQARLMTTMGSVYKQLGLYEQAGSMLEGAHSLHDDAGEPASDDAAETLNSLAGLYAERGRLADAEPLYQKALAIREATLGEGHPVTAGTLSNLGVLYARQGNFADAEPVMERAVAALEQALGPDHPDVARAVDRLGLLYINQGRLEEAEPLMRRSVDIRERTLGPTDLALAAGLSNLAMVLSDQWKLDEAEEANLRALDIREEVLGPDHPTVAISVNNLAVVYRRQGRLAEAEPLYRRTLSIRERAYGPDHLEVGIALSNLGLVYLGLDQLAEAQPVLERSLAVKENALGPDHPTVIPTLRFLAQLYSRQSRPDAAEAALKRAIATGEEKLDPRHVWMAGALTDLARLYTDQERNVEAEQLYVHALEIIDATHLADHPDYRAAREGYARLLRSIGRDQEAEAVLASLAQDSTGEGSAN